MESGNNNERQDMSEETKYTPEPWHLVEKPYGFSIEPSVCWMGNSSLHKKGENRANAKLFLAAPKIFRIIRTIYDGIHSGIGPLAEASDGEIVDMINDEMCGLFGNSWNVRDSEE